MPLNSTVAGTTYIAAQISYGSATQDAGAYTYTETGAVPLAGSATVQTYNATTGAITASVSTLLGSADLSGMVVGNDASDFLVYGTISYPGIPSQTGYVYVTNSPSSQPGPANTAAVPLESANIVYTPACYCRGTLIRTPDGERPVEDLAAGDLVSCVGAGTAPVLWIGRRSYGGRFLRANPALRPVRFRAGSLGPGLPSRDLLVSPRHAMLIDGVLVAAELLVNGATITIDAGSSTVDYFHVELLHHDAVWAEGAQSESFIDDGSRGVFHNAHTFAAIHQGEPDAAPVFCAPRVDGGEVLEAIRRRITTVRQAA